MEVSSLTQGKLNIVHYNPRYEAMFAPVIGPFRTCAKNTLPCYAVAENISDFNFESQRRTFMIATHARDPSIDEKGGVNKVIKAQTTKDNTAVFEMKNPTTEKREKRKNTDASDVAGFLGPWGGFADKKLMRPFKEEQKELEEVIAKRQKREMQAGKKPMQERTTLHVNEAYDYQGRSFLHIPRDVGVNLKSEDPPEKCFIPKKLTWTWSGHTKGVSAIRWFPRSAHLLMSCSMDCKIKLWECYNERQCIRTYFGHQKAVRDICFNNDGTRFLSAGYDNFVKFWDTETGKCISRYTNKKLAHCIKFHPDDDKQHLFVAGMSDKKIVCWDTRSNEIVQEYDQHLGAVNSITFVDENRRFVSTSDDRSLRVWEWDIPVDMKYIADPSMHSMPTVTLSPNGKWLACQSMDNKVMVFSALNRFKLNRKKTFTGHMVAGYACSLDFSPDMSYIVSGDADGKVYVWDWKTTKLLSKFKAHDSVCISTLWHPHETSKVVSAGWDGSIKLWD